MGTLDAGRLWNGKSSVNLTGSLAVIARRGRACSGHGLIDPIEGFVDACPDTGVIPTCATVAPRCGTVDGPRPLARICGVAIAIRSLCAKHGPVDLRIGVPGVLAGLVAQHSHLRLLQGVGLAAARRQSTPACNETVCTWGH